MKRQFFLSLVAALLLMACNQGKTNEQTAGPTLSVAPVANPDSLSEETVLNPKFDANKLYGLGAFKIGTSVENSIGPMISSGKYRLDSLSYRLEDHGLYLARDADKIIIKLNPPSTLRRYDGFDEASFCKKVSVFQLVKYKIDDIDLGKVILIFYEDKLVSITCRTSEELVNALKSKYGQPDSVSLYTYGQWYNGDVIAEPGEARLNFTVGIKGVKKFLAACSERDFEVQNKIDLEEKKKTLKNL